jgi:hypothetical protein
MALATCEGESSIKCSIEDCHHVPIGLHQHSLQRAPTDNTVNHYIVFYWILSLN